MEDVADALRHEAEIRGLSPDQEVEGDVEELAAEIVTGAAAAIGDPYVGLFS